MADWLCKADDLNSLDLPLRCFTLLHDDHSQAAVKQLFKLNESEHNLNKINDETQQIKKEKSHLTNDEKLKTSITKLATGESLEHVTNGAQELRCWKVCRETCPYCHVEIPLKSLYASDCPNGHAYFRCCLSLKVAIATKYRRCSSCGRKALHKHLDSELSVESVLLNIDTCPFCGCWFIDPLT